MPSPASLAVPRADATDIEPGLTLADLLDRARLGTDVRMFPLALSVALADEVEWGVSCSMTQAAIGSCPTRSTGAYWRRSGR